METTNDTEKRRIRQKTLKMLRGRFSERLPSLSTKTIPTISTPNFRIIPLLHQHLLVFTIWSPAGQGTAMRDFVNIQLLEYLVQVEKEEDRCLGLNGRKQMLDLLQQNLKAVSEKQVTFREPGAAMRACVDATSDRWKEG
ncbi:hypothetical protein PHJA_000635100 [Phtheirospermum japonicum]|uniref:Uncharacterized protein n=1 Tax=Phtheirospermum japonicum TaxID=374723 RepID=A0A830BL51_9LAMI|nr:hypothetical protein PHJA_000635100 [Phtheirospermum japonicum]